MTPLRNVDAYLLELGTLELEKTLDKNYHNTEHGRQKAAQLTRLWAKLSDDERAEVSKYVDDKDKSNE